MSLCVRDIDFSSFYDFDGGMVIVVLHFTVSNLICCVDVVFFLCISSYRLKQNTNDQLH
jgi:hypothetical protein